MLKQIILAAMIAASVATAKADSSALTVNPFQKITVTGPLNVDCVHNPDSAGTIIVNARVREQMPWVEVSQKGDKLTLKLAVPDEYKNNVPTDLPHVTVYTNYLVKAQNEGDSTLRVLSAQKVPQFEARVIGNGRLSVRNIDTEKLKGELVAGRGILVLNGKTLKANFRLTGVGTIEADGVETAEADVLLNGTGSVGVYATKKLKINGSGSGTVFFRGTPEIKKTISVGLKVQPIE